MLKLNFNQLKPFKRGIWGVYFVESTFLRVVSCHNVQGYLKCCFEYFMHVRKILESSMTTIRGAPKRLFPQNSTYSHKAPPSPLISTRLAAAAIGKRVVEL